MKSDATIDARRGDMLEHRPAERSSVPRVALICDFLEEGWPSMDLFGDMLFQTFTAEHNAAFQAEQLRPAMRYRFSKPAVSAGWRWNADRLLNRFYDYPVWLSERAGCFDLFHLMDHSYAQLLRELPADRTIVTCHDLDTFKCLLEPRSEPRPRWFRAMAQRSLNGFMRAAHVICVSSFTYAKVREHALIPPDRLSIIHPGADPIFFAAPEQAAGSAPPHRKYLLHVGSTIPRKRIDVLLRVFAHVIRDYPDLELVRVGGGLTPEQSRLAEELGIGSKVVLSPHLSKPELASIYRHAIMTLQTSDAEGFGLPVIEAMACGCPVVASDIAPLREAGGTVSDYCPPGDVDAWSQTVVELLRQYRQSPDQWESRRWGARRHAAAYTWTENARQTISVYDQVRERAALR